MSNSMLNRLKMIDNSRQRLKNILESKHITAETSSLPGLVENVNYLYAQGYGPEVWNGVEKEEEPEYFVPAFDFNAVYEADTDKNNYSRCTLYLINVNESDISTLIQNTFNSGQKYKFSDTKTLVNPARNTESPAHTWDKSKDIVGPDGNKYRWVMVYSNATDTTEDFIGSYVSLEAMVIFKGTFSGMGYRDNVSAPKYLEIKPGVKMGALTQGDSGNICTNARTVIIDADTFSIHSYVFQNCVNLEYVRMTGTYTGTDLWSYTFNNCKSLRYVKMKECPGWYEQTFNGVTDCYIEVDTVKTVMGYDNSSRYCAFTQTDGLRVKIGTVNGDWRWTSSDRDGVALSKNLSLDIGTIKGSINNSAFHQNFFRGLKLKIGEVQGNIGETAFYGCNMAPKITLKQGIAGTFSIGVSAFAGSSIREIDMLGSKITSIGNTAFEKCSNLHTLLIGDSVTSIGSAVFAECYNLNTVVIPDSVTTIASDTFLRSCIKNLTIGEGITSLPNNLFRFACTIESITLPESLTAIGTYCFAYCGNLKEILLPSKITTIPEYAFYRSGIRKVESINPIKDVGASAFNGCRDLTDFDMSHLSTVGNSAFEATNITDYRLPASLTSYGTTAFVYTGDEIRIEPGWTPTSDISLAGTDIHDGNVLKLLYELPDLTNKTAYTMTIYPTARAACILSGYRYYDGIKNRKITVNEDHLAWDNAGSMTVAQYVASKNWTIQ